MTLLLFLGAHDERALHALVLRRRPWLDRVVRAGTHLGDAAVTIPAALALLANPAWRAAGVPAALALAVSHALVQLLKRTVTRPRPRLPVGIASLIEPPDRFSFPSGHAAAALSLALPLAARLPLPAAVAVLVLGLAVGLSRCYLGVHYPGDVLAGWLLSAAALLAGSLLH